MKSLFTLFLAMILTFSISDSFGQKKSKSSKSKTSKSSSTKTETVSGYTKKDGTKVKAYKRSPKGSKKKKTSSIQRLENNYYVLFTKRKDQIEG
jgi:hypothetical protein